MDCVLRDTEGNPEIKIVKFSGFTEIDETEGTEHETIIVHFSDDSTMDFEDLDRAMMIDRRYEPVSPDWFIEEVKDHRGDSDDADEAEAERKQASGGIGNNAHHQGDQGKGVTKTCRGFDRSGTLCQNHRCATLHC